MSHTTPPIHPLLGRPAAPPCPTSQPAAGLSHAKSGITVAALPPTGKITAKRQNFLWLKAHLTCLATELEMEPEVVLSYWFHLRYLWLWAGTTPLTQVVSLQPTLPAFLDDPAIDVSLEPEPLTQASSRRVIQAARYFFAWAKIARRTQFQAVPFAWIETLQPAGQAGSLPRRVRQVLKTAVR